MVSVRKCPYCKSIRVCWNWWVVGSNHSPYDASYGHECWNCDRTHETDHKVTDGVPYAALPALKAQVERGEDVEYTEQMRILYGDK